MARLARLADKECGARLLGKLEATGALGAGSNHDAVRHAVCRHVALVAALGAANKHGGLHSKAGPGRRERVRPESCTAFRGKTGLSAATLRKRPCLWQGLATASRPAKTPREPGWPCHAGTLATARHFHCPPHAGHFPARLLRAYHAPPDKRLVQVSRRRPGEEASARELAQNAAGKGGTLRIAPWQSWTAMVPHRT